MPAQVSPDARVLESRAMPDQLRAIAFNCTLKASGDSSTDAMIAVLGGAFAEGSTPAVEAASAVGRCGWEDPPS